MKRLYLLMSFVFLLCCTCIGAFAASEDEVAAADALNRLGLFEGVGKDGEGKPEYDLDRAPSRVEAITMLVRLLGKDEEAKAQTWITPFTDVADWAKPYVGYAYQHGLTSGISASEFGSQYKVTATQYLTFVLRALGYKDSAGDFAWDQAWVLSDKIGLTNGQYQSSAEEFLRADVVVISNDALDTDCKDSSTSLLDTLVDAGAVDAEIAEQRSEAKKPQPTIFAPNIGSILERDDYYNYDYGSELRESLNADADAFTIGTYTFSAGEFISVSINTDMVTAVLGENTYYMTCISTMLTDSAKAFQDWMCSPNGFINNSMFPSGSNSNPTYISIPGDQYAFIVYYDQNYLVRGVAIVDSGSSGELVLSSVHYNIKPVMDACQARIEELKSRKGALTIRDTGEIYYNVTTDTYTETHHGVTNTITEEFKEEVGEAYAFEGLPTGAVCYVDGGWPYSEYNMRVRLSYFLFRYWLGTITELHPIESTFVPWFARWPDTQFAYILLVTDANGDPLDYFASKEN